MAKWIIASSTCIIVAAIIAFAFRYTSYAGPQGMPIVVDHWTGCAKAVLMVNAKWFCP